MALLSVLKFLGIVLLSILGLLLLILIVPVRYTVEGAVTKGTPRLETRISWLFRLISFQGEFGSGKQWNGILKAAGIRIKAFGKDAENETAQKEEAQKVQPASTVYTDEPEKNEGTEQINTSAADVEREPADGISSSADSPEERMTDKISAAFEVINREASRDAAGKVLGHVFSLLKSVLPVKGSGELTFGTGDPYRTGQILEVLTFFYPLYGKVFRITPDFCETVFEGYLSASGRIFPGKVLLEAAVIYFSKTARQLYHDIREVAA